MKNEKLKNVPEVMYPDQNPINREQMLIDNCVTDEEFTFIKEFSEEEVIASQQELSQRFIELEQIADELSETKKEYADKMKPLKDKLKELKGIIITKGQTITERVFLFDSQDVNIMAYYNRKGERVYTRNLMPNEKQARMRITKNEGTNN